MSLAMTSMTVQEILLDDSTTTVCIGVNQLKKLLTTLKHKDEEVKNLSHTVAELERENYLVFSSLSSSEEEVRRLRDEVNSLNNVKIKCKYISISDI